jgi:hypothetical protein
MKKTWTTPELTVHGAVEKITEQRTKTKRRGYGDDFAVTISSVG